MNRLTPKSILLAPVKIHLSWKMVLSGPHGCIGIALILEDGKNSFHLSVFGSLLRKLRIGCWITQIVYWSKEWAWASLHREWNRERAVEMCLDFVFVRFDPLEFHFNELRTCRTQPHSISRQTVKAVSFSRSNNQNNLGDRWFCLIGNQDCNQTKGTSFTAMKHQFGCYPDYLITKGTPWIFWRQILAPFS